MGKIGWIFLGGLAGVVAWQNPDLIDKAVDQTTKAVDKTLTLFEALDAAYLERATKIVEAQKQEGAAVEVLPLPLTSSLWLLSIPKFRSLAQKLIEDGRCLLL